MKKINNLKTARRIKIVLTIIASFFLVSTTTPHIFVSNSPYVKDSFLVWLRLTPQRMYAYMRHPLDEEERIETIENAELQFASYEEKEELNYTPIADGVYAAEDPETEERFIKIVEGTTVEVRTVIFSDGREIKVYIPIK